MKNDKLSTDVGIRLRHVFRTLYLQSDKIIKIFIFLLNTFARTFSPRLLNIPKRLPFYLNSAPYLLY